MNLYNPASLEPRAEIGCAFAAVVDAIYVLNHIYLAVIPVIGDTAPPTRALARASVWRLTHRLTHSNHV